MRGSYSGPRHPLGIGVALAPGIDGPPVLPAQDGSSSLSSSSTLRPARRSGWDAQSAGSALNSLAGSLVMPLAEHIPVTRQTVSPYIPDELSLAEGGPG